MNILSPAKINLFFRVKGKRVDGYHEIYSLYQAIDLVDTLTLNFSQGSDHFTCNHPDLPCDESNLILRAAQLYRQKTGFSFSLAVHLDKQIPLQAGLGGGSGNAATTLWALRKLTNASIPDCLLSSWGAELGSDVPFFFSKGTAYCSGRGEIVEETLIPPFRGWIAKPKEGLSTAEVYKEFKMSAKDQFSCLNDLEPAAFSLLPKLADLKADLLKMGFQQVMMTGSGTAFFCLGNILSPTLPHVQFIPFRSIQRSQHWYGEPIFENFNVGF